MPPYGLRARRDSDLGWTHTRLLFPSIGNRIVAGQHFLPHLLVQNAIAGTMARPAAWVAKRAASETRCTETMKRFVGGRHETGMVHCSVRCRAAGFGTVIRP